MNIFKISVFILTVSTMCLGGTASALSKENNWGPHWGENIRSDQGTPAQNTSADLLAKPIMGFSTWTRFGCMPQAQLSPAIQLRELRDLESAGTSMPAPLNEPSPGTSTEEQPYSFQHFMLDQAQSLVESGLSAAGYTYLNVDDCWQALDREKVEPVVNFDPLLKAALQAASTMNVNVPDNKILVPLEKALKEDKTKAAKGLALISIQKEALLQNVIDTIESKRNNLTVSIAATARSLLQGLVGPLKGAPRWEHLTQLYGTETRQRGFDTDLTNYTKYVHAMGLKVGLYTSKGDEKCTDWWPPASGHFEKTDAAAFAKWGVDFVKYDNCKTQNYAEEAAATMAAALKAASSSTGKPIVFLDGAPAYFVDGGKMGNPRYYDGLEFLRNNGVPQLRIGSDIVEYPYRDYQEKSPDKIPSPHPWSSPIKGPGEAGVFAAFRQGALLGRYTAPGHWNDLDYLMIGDNGLTSDEEQSQMSLWAILGSPLIVSSDMRKLRDAYFNKLGDQEYFNTGQSLKDHLDRSVKILKNEDAIAIDQDKLGAGGYIIQETSQEQDKGYVIAARPLLYGGLAVVVLNKGSTPLPSLDVSLEQLGYTSSGNIRAVVHDVWQNKDEVLWSVLDRININELPPHASRLYRISNTPRSWDGEPEYPKPRGLIMNNYSPEFNDGAGNKRHNSTLCWQVLSKTAQPGTQVELGYCNGDVAQTWIRDVETNTIKFAGTKLCLSLKKDSSIKLESCASPDPDVKTQQFHYYINGMIQAGERKPADHANLRPASDSQCLNVEWEGKTYSKGKIVSAACNSEIKAEISNRTDANSPFIYSKGYGSNVTNFMWAMPLTGGPLP